MTGFIYGLFDSTGLRYIGQTIKTIEWRFNKHLRSCNNSNSRKDNWLKKYKDEIYYELIGEYNIEDLNKQEIYWINYFKLIGCDLKNDTIGGDGRRGPLSEETKVKMSISKRKMSEETKVKISISKKGKPSPMLGKKHSEETIEKLKNNKHSEETIEKLRIKGSNKVSIINILNNEIINFNSKNELELFFGSNWYRRQILNGHIVNNYMLYKK